MPDLRSLCKRFTALPLLIGISSLGAALPASAQSCWDDCSWNQWMCVEDCRQWAGSSSPWNPNNYCYEDCGDTYDACMFACDNPPTDETVIKDRLNNMVSPVLGQLQDPQFRNLVYAGVARRFDGDDNVLLSTVIYEAEQAQIVNPNSPAWQSLKAQVASFQDVNGTAYDPQIYIPNYQDGALPTPDVTMVVMEDDPSVLSVPAYRMSGGTSYYIGHVDEAYTQSSEVFVLGVNEGGRCTLGADYCAPMHISNHPHPTGPCSGSRISGGEESLVRIRMPDPGKYEGPFQGKLELRLIILSQSGRVIMDYDFEEKFSRKRLKDGIDLVVGITTWDRAIWGDYMTYQWIEWDAEKKINHTIPIAPGHSVTVSYEEKSKVVGTGTVMFTERIEKEYSVGGMVWRVCNALP